MVPCIFTYSLPCHSGASLPSLPLHCILLFPLFLSSSATMNPASSFRNPLMLQDHFSSPNFSHSAFGASPLPRTIMMSAALSKGAEKMGKPSTILRGRQQVTHSMPPEKVEIFQSLQGWAEENILPFLKSVENSWQPQDFLPVPSSEGFMDEVSELRKRTAELPDDYLICLIGDMITEEALPTYQTMINTLDGVRDETGASPSSWARWTRSWTAEENRHGDLLNKYLYLTGRVDMRAVEKTTQYLISSGMDPHTENNPYLGFIYTSFQERATFISHGNTARQAKEFGDIKLAQICGTIAADERRHENAYCKIIEKLFELDPNDTMIGLEDMMRKKITMPAHLMFDGQNENLFQHFSLVAQRTGVYTAKDYLDIVEHLVKRWNLEKLCGLSKRGEQAQDYVCNLADRFRKIEERAQMRMKKEETSMPIKFSWVFNREVAI